MVGGFTIGVLVGLIGTGLGGWLGMRATLGIMGR
jgi:hypothetical protein